MRLLRPALLLLQQFLSAIQYCINEKESREGWSLHWKAVLPWLAGFALGCAGLYLCGVTQSIQLFVVVLGIVVLSTIASFIKWFFVSFRPFYSRVTEYQAKTLMESETRSRLFHNILLHVNLIRNEKVMSLISEVTTDELNQISRQMAVFNAIMLIRKKEVPVYIVFDEEDKEFTGFSTSIEKINEMGIDPKFVRPGDDIVLKELEEFQSKLISANGDRISGILAVLDAK